MPRIMNKNVWPFQVNIKDDTGKVETWCRNNLYHGGYYEPNWYRNGDTFCFKDEKEYLHFMLVWL